jgi:hypothetical protein
MEMQLYILLMMLLIMLARKICDIHGFGNEKGGLGIRGTDKASNREMTNKSSNHKAIVSQYKKKSKTKKSSKNVEYLHDLQRTVFLDLLKYFGTKLISIVMEENGNPADDDFLLYLQRAVLPDLVKYFCVKLIDVVTKTKSAPTDDDEENTRGKEWII